MTPNLSLRAATLADVEVIRNLVRAACAKWIAVIGREPMPLYQKAGYEITHTEPFKGGTTVYMTRHLDRTSSSAAKKDCP